MKLLNKFLGLAILLALFTTSCNSDDDAIIAGQLPSEPLGAYENGSFVLNEGSNASTAGVDFLSDEGVLTQDVFRIENPNEDEVGLFLQNIFFDDTRAFIISGGTNSVTVVNRFTFKYITTIESDFEAPRYGVVVGDKAYVTNRGDFSSSADNAITVIDLNNYSTSRFSLNAIAERIESVGNKLAVSNGDSFASTTTISMVDLDNNNAVTTIDLGANNVPNTMEVISNTLYVLTNSKKFITINPSTETITSTLDLPSSLGTTTNLQIHNDEVYFTVDTSVYSFGLGDTTVSATPLLTYNSTSQFGAMRGFAVYDDTIFIADAGDFASAGTFFKYDLTGALIADYVSSGVSPNGFYKN